MLPSSSAFRYPISAQPGRNSFPYPQDRFVPAPPADATLEIFHVLIGALSDRLANVAAGEAMPVIVESQRRVVEALGLDDSILFQTLNADDELVVTSTWVRPGLSTLPLRAPAKALFPGRLTALQAGQASWFTSLDEVEDAAERASFRRYGIKSNIALPLRSGERLVGVLGFSAHNAERRWVPEVVSGLRIVAAGIGGALAREQHESRLQEALLEIEALRKRLASETDRVEREVKLLHVPQRLAAESAAMREALRQVEQVAPTTATVLLTGETGSGKEVFAQALHDMSPRHQRPMVRVNCGAIPAALIESELFGRERGAYTGALSRQAGRFELAEGSTIFLDEIGELPLESQVKLLRAIQEKEIERLGSGRSIKVDVRIIAATNRNLERAVEERKFREDLYYRLKVFPITVPPLRERAEDIPALVWTFIDEFAKAFGKPIESIARQDLATLQRYAWPGNVRELRNLMERAVITATGPQLRVALPQAAQGARRDLRALSAVEAEHIRAVLDSTCWRVRGAGGAADRLGLKPTTLESRMAKLGIERT
jgi:formate hydrogenlyase transcriptional activator